MNKIKYPITNSIVFSMVMEDPAICKGLIERIFPHRKVGAVKIKERPQSVTEATLIAGIRAKPVRLDVRFEDGNNWYDIELQFAPEQLLPWRSRYYSSVGDVKMLHTGDDYDRLMPSFVIFLCCFDYFGKDEPVYEFQRFDTKLNLPLGDESYIIIVNSKCSEAKVPENLQNLFRYINDSEVTPGDDFIEVMHGRVEALQEWEEVKSIMTLEEEFRVRWRQGMKAAREEGMEEGLKEAEKKAEEKIEKAARDTETRLNALNSRLLDDDRLEDLKRSLTDAAFQRQLLDEYGL